MVENLPGILLITADYFLKNVPDVVMEICVELQQSHLKQIIILKALLKGHLLDMVVIFIAWA